MTIKELHSKLKSLDVSDDRYYLLGQYGSSDDNNKIALTAKKVKNTVEYEVYYNERGEKHSSKLFAKESDACEYMLYKIQDELMIGKVQSVIGLNGMTLNERLYATGLMRDFKAVKRKNKTRAAQILRILRVDEASIKRILK